MNEVEKVSNLGAYFMLRILIAPLDFDISCIIR